MNSVFQQIGNATGKVVLEKQDALNSDIISVIHKNFSKALSQTKQIANSFKGETPTETAQNIWNFLRNDITYKKDPENKQLVRVPQRLLADRVGDCKSYSLFAASVFKNIYPQLPVKLRYASYSIIPIPTHVYVATVNNYGNELIIDGVYKHFNEQKKYITKKDFNMNVYTLNGIGCNDDIGGLKDFLKKAGNVIKTAAQKVGSGVKNVAKKVGQGAKVIAIAPSRAAFLSLLLLNFRGFATRLASSIASGHSDKLKTLWQQKLGGDYNQLVDTINKGKSKKALLGNPMNGIGTLGEFVASASPIIIALAKFLKTLGVNDKNIDNAEIEATQAAKDADLDLNSIYQVEQTSSFNIDPKILLIGAAVVGGVLLLSKKK